MNNWQNVDGAGVKKVLGTPYKQNNDFTYGVFGIKIGLKGCVEFIYEGFFGKYLKMTILV